MMSEMTWREYLEWVVYSDLEPFDEERQDLRIAQVVTTIANANRNPKKHRAYTVKDFLMRWGDSPKLSRKQTWQEQKQIGHMMFAMFNRPQGDGAPQPMSHRHRRKERR